MSTYALIENGFVKELLVTSNNINDMFNTSEFNWVMLSDNQEAKIGQMFKDGVFSNPVEVTASYSHEELIRLRQLAYADPITGSDRFFAEAMSISHIPAMKKELADLREKGLERQKEIKLMYPLSKDVDK